MPLLAQEEREEGGEGGVEKREEGDPKIVPLLAQDPGSGREIPVKWHGTGARHGVFSLETLH